MSVVSLVLLNDTLRLHDNPLLHCSAGSNQRKAAVIVLNKTAFFGQQYGIKRANLQRLQQQLIVISVLKAELARKNIGLITLFGDTVNRLTTLAQQLAATQLYCAEPVAPFESLQLKQLSRQLHVTQLDCNSLLADHLRPDLTRLPSSFTPFRKQREPLLLVSAPITTSITAETWLTPAETTVYNIGFDAVLQHYLPPSARNHADEHTALNHVQQYIWQNQHILHYKDTRNQLHGKNYASFCSSALAVGSLSVRQLWQEIVQFEQQITANESTYWLKFELLWREFFRWQFRKHGAHWFSKNAIKGPADFSPPLTNSAQQRAFYNWCNADSGVAFIDANMRLLNQTGLMSNRGRQNVASYLIHDLGVDWRLGAAYFEQRLLDYDCASNWGNWAYIAGTGNSTERQFNVQKQASLYDPTGSFVDAMSANNSPL